MESHRAGTGHGRRTKAGTGRPTAEAGQDWTTRSVRGTDRRRRGEEGASLVEFAILAPLLFMLIFGMITGGMALSYKNSMSNAVREGSRLGATLESGPGWAEAVRTRVSDLAAGDLDPEQVCVTLEGSEPPRATSCAPELAALEPDSPPDSDGCVVKVWARRTADLNAILVQRPLTLDVQAVAKYERGDSC